MSDAATLAVVLTAKDGITSVLQGVTKELDNTHKAALATGAAMSAMGVGIIATFASMGKVAADFEQSMSNVKSVMTAGEVNQFSGALNDLALKLGKDTVYSAKEAAGALEELVKGGVKVPDILNGAAEAALNLASAGGVSLKDAAEIASNAMNMFSISGENMAHVADLIAGAANASSMEVGDFKFALAQAGAVANLTGLSFDDTAVAISSMAAAGLKGSDAGTSLKSMLVSLVPSSKEAIAQFRNLGLITADGANQFFDASGKIKSYAEIAQVLQTALAGLSEQEQISALHTAFGTDAMRAAAIAAKAGAEGINEMAAAMGAVTASEVAKTRLDNLNGSIKQLQGSMETLAIQIGGQMAPGFRSLVDGVTGVLNAMLELPAPIIASIGQIGLMTGVVLTLGGGLISLGAVLPALTAGLQAFGLTIGLIAGPVVLVTAAIAAGILAWNTDFQGFRTNVEQVIEHLGPVFTSLGQMFQQVVADIGLGVTTVKGIFGDFGGTAGETATEFGAASSLIVKFAHDDLIPALQLIGSVAHEAWLDFLSAAVETWIAMQPTREALTTFFLTDVPAFLTAAQESWDSFWGQLGPTVVAAWAVIEPPLLQLKDMIGTVLPPTFEALKTVASTTISVIANDIKTIGAVLGPMAQLFNATLGKLLTDLSTNDARMEQAMKDMFSREFALSAEDAAVASEQIGTYTMRGILIGMTKENPEVQAAIKANVRAMIDAAKEEAGIQSPSSVMAAEVGQPLAEGISEGFEAALPAVETTITTSLARVTQNIAATNQQQIQDYIAQVGKVMPVYGPSASDLARQQAVQNWMTGGQRGPVPGTTSLPNVGGYGLDPYIALPTQVMGYRSLTAAEAAQRLGSNFTYGVSTAEGNTYAGLAPGQSLADLLANARSRPRFDTGGFTGLGPEDMGALADALLSELSVSTGGRSGGLPYGNYSGTGGGASLPQYSGFGWTDTAAAMFGAALNNTLQTLPVFSGQSPAALHPGMLGGGGNASGQFTAGSGFATAPAAFALGIGSTPSGQRLDTTGWGTAETAAAIASQYAAFMKANAEALVHNIFTVASVPQAFSAYALHPSPGLGNTAVNTGGSGAFQVQGNTPGGANFGALQALAAQITAEHPDLSASSQARLIQQGMRTNTEYLRVVGSLTDTTDDLRRQQNDAATEMNNLANAMATMGSGYASANGMLEEFTAAQARLNDATNALANQGAFTGPPPPPAPTPWLGTPGGPPPDKPPPGAPPGRWVVGPYGQGWQWLPDSASGGTPTTTITGGIRLGVGSLPGAGGGGVTFGDINMTVNSSAASTPQEAADLARKLREELRRQGVDVSRIGGV